MPPEQIRLPRSPQASGIARKSSSGPQISQMAQIQVFLFARSADKAIGVCIAIIGFSSSSR